MGVPDKHALSIAAERTISKALEAELDLASQSEDALQKRLGARPTPFPFDEAHDICHAAIQMVLGHGGPTVESDIERTLSAEAEDSESALRKLFRDWVRQVFA